MALKVFRTVAAPSTFKVVGHDGPRNLAGGLNQFSADLRVQPGDILGSNWSGAAGACTFFTPSEAYDYRPGDLPDATTDAFNIDATHNSRVNISAEITPTSDYTLGKAKSKANGTAKLAVTVPNPGDLTVSGGGAKKSSPGRLWPSTSRPPGPSSW
jgi:hypothetical protein